MHRIYLDHNATTPLAPEALAAMLPFLSGGYEGRFGNPSSIHAAGRDALAGVDDARYRLAAVLGANPRELIFTGGGTEADNLAVIGLSRARVRTGAERHVITSQIEHHAVLHAVDFLEQNEGFRTTRLPVDSRGIVDPDALRRALTPQTALVSIHSANNETGTIQPVRELATLCRAQGVPFHSDMVQSFGKEPVRVDGPDAPDALSLAAHKFYGPKGVGVLWVRPGLMPDPILFGGAQEFGRRPGTESPALLAGMATAARLAADTLPTEAPRLAPLRDRLWEGLAALYPAAVRNGAWETPALQLANTLNVSFPGLDGETLLIHCDLAGVCVSSGSACMAGSPQPSHVLLAMGRSVELAEASLRFSLGKVTNGAEIDAALERLARIFARVQRIK